MSDDIWRRKDDTTEDSYGTDFGSDFGTVQFADDPTAEPALSFGGGDTGNLPHWTEPATGEIPVVDEDDVWGAFDEPSTPTARPERLTIGTDPTGGARRDVTGGYDRDPSRDITGGVPRGARPQPVRRVGPRGPRTGGVGRDMPTAVTTALILVAVFIGAIMWRPAAVMLIVLAVVGLAAVEFFSKVTEKGYRPATFAGLITCVAAPLAAYWIGDEALPLVLAFGFMAMSIGFIGATSVQSGPMPNVAITTMAMTWIGLMGSFAALMLRYSVNGVGDHVGTDTLFMVVVAVIANDVGALFVGASVGRTPLREWVSPNKTVEGAIGGALASVIALVVIGSQNGTWNTMGEWLALALVVAVMAPLGDLVESMFKRNLDVKDFGTIVAGHGGVLDRFDGFLFVLPATYYLMLVIQPWA
jgi:phosphatidate cytidylyltransferase